MAAFGWASPQFWHSTPIEIYHLFKAWGEFERDRSIERWEIMRLQTYYLIDIQLQKKSKVTYQRFKNQYMGFAWDKNTGDPDDTEKLLAMTPEDWAEKDRIAEERRKNYTNKKAT